MPLQNGYAKYMAFFGCALQHATSEMFLLVVGRHKVVRARKSGSINTRRLSDVKVMQQPTFPNFIVTHTNYHKRHANSWFCTLIYKPKSFVNQSYQFVYLTLINNRNNHVNGESIYLVIYIHSHTHFNASWSIVKIHWVKYQTLNYNIMWFLIISWMFMQLLMLNIYLFHMLT